MRRALCVLLVALVPMVLSACGGGSASMSDAAASRLHAGVAAVRAAVGVRDVAGAAHALDDLRASVDRLRRSGDLSSERATEILTAASAVSEQLVTITTTTTTTTTTSPPPPPPTKGHRDDDQGQGNGSGRGNGKEKGAR